jgi:23S rRNA C2498 (ribose-2'-O)-methylase RlmM
MNRLNNLVHGRLLIARQSIRVGEIYRSELGDLAEADIIRAVLARFESHSRRATSRCG